MKWQRLMGQEAAGLETAGPGTAGLETAGPGTAGLETAGLETTGTEDPERVLSGAVARAITLN